MHTSVFQFFVDGTEAEDFAAKKILEVGSKYVNGSVRPLIEKFYSPKQYIGVDIEAGRYVDVILPAEKIAGHFGPESFDVLITTEMLEHVKDWRATINNMKTVIKRQGCVYLTTRSKGMEYHAFPYDFWRYEIEEIAKIFADFEVITLKKDEHGVLLKAKKPENYVPTDLSDITLYSMVLGRRTKSIPDFDDMPISRKLMVKFFNSKARNYLPPVLSDRLKGSFLT